MVALEINKPGGGVRLGELGGKSKPAFSCLTLIDSCGGSIKYDLMVAGSKYYIGWFCTLHNRFVNDFHFNCPKGCLDSS